jgi:hypothetical protein
MNPARVKAEQNHRRYCAKLYGNARNDAIRETEALLELLKRGAPLRQVHFAAYDTHMAAGLLYSHAAWLARARKRAAAAKAGKRARTGWEILGWPEPSDVYNARQKREKESRS